VLLIVIVLVVVIVIAVLGRDTDDDAAPATTQAEQSEDAQVAPDASDAGGDEAEPPAEEPDPSDAGGDEIPTITPEALPTLPDKTEEPVSVEGPEGKGTLTVSTEWMPADDLESSYGGTVDPSPEGDFLVVTAHLEVTEGSMELQPFYFKLKTPYGGTLDPATQTFGLKGSGIETTVDGDTAGVAPTTFAAGEEYTIRLLYTPKRAGGMELQYDNFTMQEAWDVKK
jgi:hypothetical protein